MNIVISAASPLPIYSQISRQLAAQILRGELAAGEALPPIRSLARQLEVSVITVKKAWEELEREGFIDAVVGKGSFVAASPPGQPDKRADLARRQLARELPFYRDLGYNQDEFIALVRQQYDVTD